MLASVIGTSNLTIFVSRMDTIIWLILHLLSASTLCLHDTSSISKGIRCFLPSENLTCIQPPDQLMTLNLYFTLFASAWMNSTYLGSKITSTRQAPTSSLRTASRKKSVTISIYTNVCLLQSRQPSNTFTDLMREITKIFHLNRPAVKTTNSTATKRN